MAADAASALLLYRMAQACTRRKVCARCASDARAALTPTLLAQCLESPAADDAARPASPAACALLFLWNPCAIASCVGCGLRALPPACPCIDCGAEERRLRRRCWSALETAAVLAGARRCNVRMRRGAAADAAGGARSIGSCAGAADRVVCAGAGVRCLPVAVPYRHGSARCVAACGAGTRCRGGAPPGVLECCMGCPAGSGLRCLRAFAGRAHRGVGQQHLPLHAGAAAPARAAASTHS